MTTHLLSPAQDRIAAILYDGRGTDGSLGVVAQRRALAAGQLRRADVPLSDQRFSGNLFSRAAFIDWTTEGDEPAPSNDYDPVSRSLIRFDLIVGYVEGIQLAGLVHKITGDESKPTVAQNATMVALSDARRIRRALCYPQLHGGGPELDPGIIDLRRDGIARVQRLGGGRLICTQTFILHVEIDNDESYT